MGNLSVLEAVGIVVGVIAVLLSGSYVVLKLAYTLGKNTEMLRDLLERFEKLPCAERKEEINEVKTDIVVMKSDIIVIKSDIVEMKADIVEVKSDIVEMKVEIAGMNTRLDSIDMSLFCINYTLSTIGKWIMNKDHTMIDPLTANLSLARKNSPRGLSELGQKVIGIIGGMKFLEDHKDFFINLIDEKNPKTALDIESSAYFVCFSSIDNDIFIPIKNIIYHAPPIKVINKDGNEVDFNMDIFNACSVLSIPLRDMYLQEHPEFLGNIL